MLSPSESLTFTASIAELIACLGYLFLVVVIVTSRIPTLKTPFYTIFAITGVTAILNLIVIIILRLFNQVFYFGPEFGQACNFLSYLSHIFVFAHSVLKAMQVTNRFTALFFPLKHDEIWFSRLIWVSAVVNYAFPAAMYCFLVVNQPALYSDIGGGRLKYAGIEKTAQEIAKISATVVHGLFIAVTLPMNLLLLVKMRRLRREDNALFIRERMYAYYVVVITVAQMVKGAHQIFWLYATVTQNSNLNFIATYTYAYPNTITTFTPPIALVLMSKQVRNGIRIFISQPRIESADSAYSQNIRTVTPMQ